MPRQARLDAPGTLHHVMIRGIERSPIFKDDQDRKDFISEGNGVKSLFLTLQSESKIGNKSLFFTPEAKGAIVWLGCRPTGMKVEAWTVQIVQI